MPWSPEQTELKVVDELFVYTDYEQTFSYTGEEGTDYVVTGIVADRSNNLMNVGVDTISGQYDGEPHGGSSIYYLKKDKTYETVSNFDDITNSYEICSYTPPMIQTVTYSYTVTAEDQNEIGEPVEQTYTVVATFSWDAGKAALLNAVAETRIGR